MKKLFLTTIIIFILGGCAANKELQYKVNGLEQENQRLSKSIEEYKNFIENMYSKIENSISTNKSIEDNDQINEIDKLKSENERLKQEIENYKKYISNLYNFVDPNKK